MTYIAALAIGVTVLTPRRFPANRRIFRHVTLAVAAMPAARAIVAWVAFAATWMMAASPPLRALSRIPTSASSPRKIRLPTRRQSSPHQARARKAAAHRRGERHALNRPPPA